MRIAQPPVTKISDMDIDVDKDWNTKKIENLGSPDSDDDAARKDTTTTALATHKASADDHPDYLKEKLKGGVAGETPEHTHQAVDSCGKLDHGLALDGLGDDDHGHYLNITRHDVALRHSLANLDPLVCSQAEADSRILTHKNIVAAHHAKTVSSDIDHGGVGGLTDDDHGQYLNIARHDVTARHPLAVLDGLVCSQAEADSKITAALSIVTPSDDLLASANTEHSSDIYTWVKIKEIRVLMGGEYRIKFDIKGDSPQSAQAKIEVDGVLMGSQQSNNTSDYVTKSQDINGFVGGDVLELWFRSGMADRMMYCKNFKVYGELVPSAEMVTD